MKRFPIAIQLYSVRNEAKNNLYGTLKAIKAMGYDGVEFAGSYGHTADEIREMCADIGLEPISAHVAYLDMIANPEETIGKYAKIGCKYVAVPYLNEEYRPGTEQFPEVVENIKKLGAVANRLGLKLLYHNHDFEFTKLNGKYALDVLYEEVDAGLLQTELDTCWVKVGGEDPAAYLLKYSGRAPVLHLKDFEGEKSADMYELIGMEKTAPKKPKAFAFRPVGYGRQDFPSILKAAEQAGVTWLVVEQDEPTTENTPLECAKMSRDYLKKLGL